MKQLFAEVGEVVTSSHHCAPTGAVTHLGNNVYVNFNLTLVGDTDVFIGDNVMIAPRAARRRLNGLKAAQFNVPVRICKNVWLSAHTVVLPGVTIGENSVIGAGSIVTKRHPSQCGCRW